jgi:hypothetical protein
MVFSAFLVDSGPNFNQKMLCFLLRCCRSPLQFFKMPTFTIYCKNQYETHVFTFSVISDFRQKRANILPKIGPKNKVRKGLQNRLKIDPKSEVFRLIGTGNCYTYTQNNRFLRRKCLTRFLDTYFGRFGVPEWPPERKDGGPFFVSFSILFSKLCCSTVL